MLGDANPTVQSSVLISQFFWQFLVLDEHVHEICSESRLLSYDDSALRDVFGGESSITALRRLQNLEVLGGE